MNLTKILEIAKNEMADKRSSFYNQRGDKFGHGQRVAKIALELKRRLFPLENQIDEILTVSAWFHDIMNSGGGVADAKLHGQKGAEKTAELLKDHIEADTLKQICDIIFHHDDRAFGANSDSIALKIHQDADHLDHFGSLGIWKFVCYNVGHNHSIDDAIEYTKTKRKADEARWLNGLHFDISKAIMKEKLAYEQQYFRRLMIENDGKFIGNSMSFEEFLEFRDVKIKNATHEKIVKLFYNYLSSATGDKRLLPDLIGRLTGIDTSNLTVPTGCFNGIFDGTIPPYPNVDFYVKLSDETRIFIYGEVPQTPLVELQQNHYVIFVLSDDLNTNPDGNPNRHIFIAKKQHK